MTFLRDKHYMQGTIVAMAAKMPEVILTEYGLLRVYNGPTACFWGQEHDAAAKKLWLKDVRAKLPTGPSRLPPPLHLRRATEVASRPSESRQGQSDVHRDRCCVGAESRPNESCQSSTQARPTAGVTNPRR